MRLSTSGFSPGQQEDFGGEKRCLNSELWHACAGPLVSLPTVGSRVVYFPQGHSEQVAASTNKEVDAQFPNHPSLPPQLLCQLHNVTMHADVDTDEVYAQMTLQPLSPQEQKNPYPPSDFGASSKQPTNYFCKTLTASDTSTHGGFSVPRRAAEKVFPPLDFTQQPPAQELIARDIHDKEWKFRHIFRGQPKRHLLTTGWSVFVSAKRLVAGDSVLFIWNEKNQLLLGIRRASRPQTVMPSSVLSSDSMHLGLLAAAAHAAATNSRFTIFYNPRASPSEFVIPLSKYVKAVYHTNVSVGMRFRMLFETEESSVRRYMGTITGISDSDLVRWPNSHWRSVKVGWDESTAGEKQPRVSLWEIEPLTTFPMYPSAFPFRLKRPWPTGLTSFYGMKDDDLGMNAQQMWLRGNNNINNNGGDHGIQSLNFQGPLMQQPRLDPSLLGLQPQQQQPDMYQAMAAAALQEMRVVDPFQFQPQSPQIIPNRSATSLPQPLMANQHPQLNLMPDNNSQTHLLQQQLQHHPFYSPNSQFTSSSPSMASFSNANSNLNPTVSPLQTLLGSFHQEESPLSYSRPDPLPNSTNGFQNSISLPPFPGKECSGDQEGNNGDPHNHLLFGVNIEPGSVLLQNGMTSFRGVSAESDSSGGMPFTSSNFMTSDNFAHSSCVDESGFLSPSQNVDPQCRSFVKVHMPGTFGRSLDIAKFRSYKELRRELGRMFGLEGQLEEPLRSGWQLVFVDREGDVLLLGDGPWPEFVNSVESIRILSVEQMTKGGLDVLHSLPIQKLSGSR